jgi:2Fe-2S ferredoxin
MPKITFVTYDGQRYEVEAQPGQSMMQAATANSVPGIDADCGGQCSCATCHVIVGDHWFDAVGPAGDMEGAMLSLTPERTAHSRLSCQIEMDDRLDGIEVRIPQYQM